MRKRKENKVNDYLGLMIIIVTILLAIFAAKCTLDNRPTYVITKLSDSGEAGQSWESRSYQRPSFTTDLVFETSDGEKIRITPPFSIKRK